MQVDGGDAVLTDLCAICHTNSIKYTCPRCGIHTCSLPCVKRHKAWAQCSGIRNPAAYRKRADLATPSSIDQDFNFITSVERSLQRADESANDKGIDLAPSGVKRKGPGLKWKFDAEVEERGIRLIRAPSGLSRNKQNKSHWAGGPNKCIIWTTEWVFHDGQRKITNVRETRTVVQGFLGVFGRKTLDRKRKRDVDETDTAAASQHETAATRHNTATEEPAKVETKNTTATTAEDLADAKRDLGSNVSAEDDDTIYGDEEIPLDSSEGLETEVQADQVAHAAAGKDSSDNKDDFAVKSLNNEAPQTMPASMDDTEPQMPTEEESFPAQEESLASNVPDDNLSQLLSHFHFYLLRPNTAKYKCLIPLAQESTLKDVLHGKTVLEFPTFYVREEAPESLPEPFISEEKYTQLYGSEIPISLPTYTAPDDKNNSQKEPLTDIDEKKMLEVLQQDLTG